MNWLIDCDAEATVAELGGKGFALAAAQRAGMPVPPWFALTPAACEASRGSGGDFELPAALRAQIERAIQQICPHGELVAVRSSAVDEDGAKHSFAGQLESFLFVSSKDALPRIVDVWRSALATRVVSYRRRHGLAGSPPAPAVLVQKMVQAKAAGVAFSADPVSGRRALTVVAAVPGVAAGLVSGEKDADTWHIDRSGTVESRSITGVHACMSDEEAGAVTRLARRCGQHFGKPQDIEWAHDGSTLWLLQSRPITSLGALADPDGAQALWDSSNIGESYSGVTTPLTFSYIRHAYEHVYRQLCRIGGIDEAIISGHDDVFRRMLGLIGGRVHYNLLGWYRLLALTPGFEKDFRLFDEMLGIREHTTSTNANRGRRPRLSGRQLLAIGRQCLAIARSHFTVDRRNRRFFERLENALTPPSVPLDEMRADELADHFRSLERALLTKWDAPVVNDFFAMIFHGVLTRLIKRWFQPRDSALANDLLSGEAGIISVEPARRIRELARLAKDDPALVDLLLSGRADQILQAIQHRPAFVTAYNDYVARFGERCLEELKLESATLVDDPLLLLRAVGQLASSGRRKEATTNFDARARAEERVRNVLGRYSLKAIFFNWVLRNARARVRDRENLRFERTRVFGRVRRIFVEIGKRFWAIEALDAPRDIFWLELNEVLGFIDGTATCTNLKGLAALRKTEFDEYRNVGAPDRRFETRGIVYHGNSFRNPARAAAIDATNERSATGCCPGTVRGPARVIRSPHDAEIRPGEILVAERTDPGWILLFASAAGLVIEHGSLLSHAAIVARELGIPAVIGVTDACAWLTDGDEIELDGTAGTVCRVQTEMADARLRSAA